ncbi:hypothetical protein FPRO04_08728 [Fusarium proliferatum]|nr:hypothetical protein FPRO03_02005 [Fusarium proliferatum]KAG4275066.1 hypothetical protein FPRO04_08728 [Fusarium proliferatum]
MALQQLNKRDLPELRNICQELFKKYASPDPECSAPRNRAAQHQQRFSTIDLSFFNRDDTSLYCQKKRELVIKQLVVLRANLEFAALHDIELKKSDLPGNSFEDTVRRELAHQLEGTPSEAMEAVGRILDKLDELRGRGAIPPSPHPGVPIDTQDTTHKSVLGGGVRQAQGEVVNETNKEISLATREKMSDSQQAQISPEISAPSQEISPKETAIEITDNAGRDSSISAPSSMNSSLVNYDCSGFVSILEDTTQPNGQPSNEGQAQTVETTSAQEDAMQLDAFYLEEQAHSIQIKVDNAKVLFHLHMYQEAEAEYDSILALHSEFMKTDNTSTILVEGNLANAIAKQGRIPEAEDLYSKTWVSSAELHGEAHPHTLASRSNYASMLEQRGAYTDAVIIYRHILQVRRTEGHSRLDTISSSNKLANALMRLGEFPEARNIYTETLQSHIDELGEGHPNTIITLGNLVNSLQNQGKSREAKERYLSRMKLGLRALDCEHPCWDWLRVRFEALRDYRE